MEGFRNETARERRRQRLGLTPSSTSEVEVSSTESTTSSNPGLSDHFGWAVLSRNRVEDGTFPHCNGPAQVSQSTRNLHQSLYILQVDDAEGFSNGQPGPTDEETPLVLNSGPTVVGEPFDSEESKLTLPQEEYNDDKEKPLTTKTEKKTNLISKLFNRRSNSARRANSKEEIKAGDSISDKQAQPTSKNQMSKLTRIFLSSIEDSDDKRFGHEKGDASNEVTKNMEEKEDRNNVEKDTEKKRGRGLTRFALCLGGDDDEGLAKDNRPTDNSGLLLGNSAKSKLLDKSKGDLENQGRRASAEKLLSTKDQPSDNQYLFVAERKHKEI